MKKLMIMAAMVLSASAAVAGNSDQLKAILKAKTYADASQLVKTTVDQLANNAEKAKAYDKLYTLALDDYKKINAVQTENAKAALTKQEVQPYDTAALYENAYNAVMAALECDKYDNMPNAKGEIDPKYRNGETNKLRAQEIYNTMLQLIGGGQWVGNKNDDEGLLKYWGCFLDNRQAPLFNEVARAQEDAFLGQVAFYAAAYAQRLGKFDLANKYFDMCANDKEFGPKAQEAKLALQLKNLKTHEDSLNYVSTVKARYDKDGDETAFTVLCDLYNNLKMENELNSVVEKHLQTNPNSLVAWVYKAQNDFNIANSTSENANWDPAINDYKKILEIDSTRAAVYTGLGQCLVRKATAINNRQLQKPIFTEALGYLQKAQELDPDNDYKWAYFLYVCYGSVFSYNDDRAVALKTKYKF